LKGCLEEFCCILSWKEILKRVSQRKKERSWNEIVRERVYYERYGDRRQTRVNLRSEGCEMERDDEHR
jgi:hypothetical protein